MMPGGYGPGVPGALLGNYEGAFASAPIMQNLETRAPFKSLTAGPGAARASAPGTIQGRFGWLNSASGLVNNTRTASDDAQGIVIPFRSLNGSNGGVMGGPRSLAGPQASWTWEFYDPSVTPCGGLRVRPGLAVTMAARGNFWLRFAGGAIPGNQVYASLTDGSAISGAADGAELTPWLVVTLATPGQLAIVSTAAMFTP
jgi:hypothetical protein